MADHIDLGIPKKTREKGHIAAGQSKDGPGAARAQRLADLRGGREAPFDAGDADPQAAIRAADVVEFTLGDERVLARAADAQADGGLGW